MYSGDCKDVLPGSDTNAAGAIRILALADRGKGIHLVPAYFLSSACKLLDLPVSGASQNEEFRRLEHSADSLEDRNSLQIPKTRALSRFSRGGTAGGTATACTFLK